MNKNINLKIIVTVLFAIMLISFAIALILFSLTGGFKSFNIIGETSLINKEETLQIKDVKNIEINTISEEVIIIPTNDKEAKIIFYTNIPKNNSKYEPELIISQLNKDLIISIIHKKLFQFSMFKFHEKSRVELYLPVEYSKDFSISVLSGDIFMENFKLNNVNYKTVSGDIKIDKVYANDISINTTSGDIKINGECNNFALKTVSGDFSSFELFTKKSELRTTSGDVSIKSFKGDFKSNHVSGDVEVNYLEYNNDIFIKTVSGDIDIVLPKDAQFKLNFKSTSGDYNGEFPITIKNINKKHNVEGIVGSENNIIEATTVSGDLEINN